MLVGRGEVVAFGQIHEGPTVVPTRRHFRHFRAHVGAMIAKVLAQVGKVRDVSPDGVRRERATGETQYSEGGESADHDCPSAFAIAARAASKAGFTN